MLERFTTLTVTPRKVRIALLAALLVVMLSGEVVAAESIPEKCRNPEGVPDVIKYIACADWI
jgi:hypothetical protein